MEGFWKLIAHFNTQDDPSFCGPATLAMVLNALAIDPCRKWKGQWRWFDESMLICWEELEIVKTEGITFGKFVSMAQDAGAKVEAFRASSTSIDEFRKNVIECSTSRNCHVILSYHRAALKQSGSGHFSPIGGYHRGKDMALVLDVARFKYPPHWVPLEALWEGMSYVDDTTGQTRGFMVISRPHRELGMLYSLSCNRKYWCEITKFLTVDVPMLLKSEVMKDIDEVLLSIAATLPSCFEDFIKWFSEIRRQEEGGRVSKDEKARLALKEEVLKQVQGTELFKHVDNVLSNRMPPASTDVLTVLLLSLPPATWDGIRIKLLSTKIRSLVLIDKLPTLLQEEVLQLKRQIHLLKMSREGKLD